jgi:hypothetical protein
MVDVYKGNINNKNIICFHGNKKVFFDQKTIDIVMSGHTHHYSLRKENGIIYLNPGSLTYPRDGSKGSFAVITDDGITIFDVDYKILAELYFKA